MNLEELNEDIIAAINQFYTYDEVLPYSRYRVQLVNKLIAHANYLKRVIAHKKAKELQAAVDAAVQAAINPPEPQEPDLPWD